MTKEIIKKYILAKKKYKKSIYAQKCMILRKKSILANMAKKKYNTFLKVWSGNPKVRKVYPLLSPTLRHFELMAETIQWIMLILEIIFASQSELYMLPGYYNINR